MPLHDQHHQRVPTPASPLAHALARVATALVLLLPGCMRSAPLATDDIDCGIGVGIVIDASAFCIYPTPDVPDACPEALPNRFEEPEAVVCARQARPAGGLIERAVRRALDTDGGLFIVDAGARDGRPGLRVVDGGATRADF